MKRFPIALALLALTACAGRTPAPVATVRAEDRQLDCFQIAAEVRANTRQIADLSEEESEKVAQNVLAGVGGLLIWPLWFAMDFQDAAGKETEALASRNAYLGELYARKDCAEAAPDEAGEELPAAATAD